MAKNKNNQAIWNTRIKKNASSLFQKVGNSIDIDKRLYKEDIQGSIAHVEMLFKQKIISFKIKNKIRNGLIKINGRAGDDYLNFNPLHLNSIKAPLQTLGLENSYDILVNVFGGGLTGQADAIKQGAARTLCELSPDNRKPLKTEGHLSRDPRAKERRKYGLKKARKAPQFSKR